MKGIEFNNHYDNDHPLHDIVIDELWGDLDVRAELMEDVDNWIIALTQIIENVDGQFVDRKAVLDEFEAECGADRVRFREGERQYRDWKRKASSFKRRVVQRLREVKQMRRERNVAGNTYDELRKDALREIVIVLKSDDPYATVTEIRAVLDRLRAAGALA